MSVFLNNFSPPALLAPQHYSFRKQLVLAACLLLLLPGSYAQDYIWASGMSGSALGTDITIDANENVYVVGRFSGTVDFDPGPNNFDLTSQGSNDVFIQKLDPSGNLIWVKIIGGPNAEGATSIILDGNNNILIAGDFGSAGTDFDPGPAVVNLPHGGSTDGFVLKLNPSGNFLWAVNVGANSGDFCTDVAVNSNDEVFIIGKNTFGTFDFDPGPGVAVLGSNTNGYILKLDSNGNFVWVKGFRELSLATFWHEGLRLAIDATDNIHLCGNFSGSIDFDPGAGISVLSTPNFRDFDMFVVKLDGNGNFLWGKSIGEARNASTIPERAQSIAVDANGNVGVTGTFTNTVDFDPGAGVSTMAAVGSGDMYILKLDPSGNFIWAKQMGGPGNRANSTVNYEDDGRAIAFDAIGNIYTTGTFLVDADFDPGPATFTLTSSVWSVFVSTLDPSGNFVWASQIEGGGRGIALGIAVDANEDVYTTGNFSGFPADFSPGPGMANISGRGAYVWKLGFVPCPSIACPGDITVPNTPGQCDAVVTYTTPIGASNCPAVTVVCTPPSGSIFPVGTTSVTCTATDATGNVASCSFDVIVEDTEGPVIMCPADITEILNPPTLLAHYPLLTNLNDATGNLSPALLFGSSPPSPPSPGNPLCINGENIFSGSPTQRFSTPVIPAFDPTNFGIQVEFKLDGYSTSSTNNPGLFGSPVIMDGSSFRRIGIYVNDAGFAGIRSNNGLPVYSTTQVNLNQWYSAELRFANNEARLYIDGVLVLTENTGPLSTGGGPYSFSTSSSSPGNTLFGCIRNLKVGEGSTGCGAEVTFSATATDNCPGTTISYSPPSGSMFTVGTTQVTATATDASGINSASCTFNVTVVDNAPPTISCPADITVGNDLGQCDAVVTFATTVSDNCPGATVVCTPASGSTFPVGTTPVTCTATDASGNTSTCTFNVIVNDTEAPFVGCPGNITVSNDVGQCGANVFYNVSINDNCPGVMLDIVPNTSFFPVGTTTVTATATDAAGNTATCTFDITVNFINPPDVQPIGDQVVCNGLMTMPVMFTGSVPGTVFEWTNSDPSIGLPAMGAGDIMAFTATNLTAAPVTATITVTPTLPPGNACSGPSETFTITVLPTPVLNYANPTVCSSTPATLVFLNIPANTTLNWPAPVLPAGLLGAPTPGGGGAITDIYVNTTNSPIDVTYFVTVNNNVCPTPVILTVNPGPMLGNMDKTVCSGEPVAMTLMVAPGSVPATGYRIQAVKDPGLSGTPTTGNNLPANAISGDVFHNNTAGPLDVTYTITPLGSCEGVAKQIVITVTPSNARNNVTIRGCEATTGCGFTIQNLTLFDAIIAPAGCTVTWYIGTGTAFPVPNPTAFQSGSTALTVVATCPGNSCVSTEIVQLVLEPKPAPPSVSELFYCVGDAAPPLTASGLPGATYRWYASEANALNKTNASTTPPTPSTASAGVTSYWVTQRGAFSCESRPAELKVTVVGISNLSTTYRCVGVGPTTTYQLCFKFDRTITGPSGAFTVQVGAVTFGPYTYSGYDLNVSNNAGGCFALCDASFVPDGQTVTISVKDVDANCGASATFVEDPCANLGIAPIMALNGNFDASTGLMRDDLRQQGLIPTTEPYTGLGFTHVGGGGGETINPTVLQVTGNDAIVDWVFVELRDPANPQTVLATRSALLQRDGDIVDVDGVSSIGFYALTGSYNVSVRHRNHLGAMTLNSVPLTAIGTSVNFGTMATYGTQATVNVAGTNTLVSGNVIPDGKLQYSGPGNDRAPILTQLGGLNPTAVLQGVYSNADANMDGVVKYSGPDNDRAVILGNLGNGADPTLVRFEQMP